MTIPEIPEFVDPLDEWEDLAGASAAEKDAWVESHGLDSACWDCFLESRQVGN